jgi:hypothetical protein
MLSFCKKKPSETFTYYIPSPPERSTGYREKELDAITKMFIDCNIEYNIETTISGQNGFWVVFNLFGGPADFIKLKESERYQEFSMDHTSTSDQLELIHEHDDDFNDENNFQY